MFIVRCLLLTILMITASHAGIRYHFGPVEEGNMHLADHFLKWIGKAKVSLQGAFYEFRDPNIIDGFIAAHERGVKVQLVVDSDNFFLRNHDTLEIDYDQRNKYVKRLLDAGIEVKEDQKRSGLMHNKFCVRDGKALWTGSYNLTDTGYMRNENNALEFDSKKLSEIYLREFKEMFEDQQFGISSPSTISHQKVTVGKTPIEVYFAPEDNPVLRIYEHMLQAKEEIYFMQFAMTANDLGDLMIQKHRDGLKVKGIFDRMLYRSTGPYAEFSKLTRNGVQVVVYDSPLQGKLHHKVFILDPNGENPKVITGSLNASANGNKTNDENIIIIQDKKITQAYFKKFKELFGRTSRVVASFKNIRPIKAGQIIPRVTLMVSSNGVKTDKLAIQFPARWPKEQENLGLKVFRLKEGKLIDTTSQENLMVTSKNLYIRSANLATKGEGALIMVKMTNVKAPEIPGMYNLYIKAKSRFQAYYPLKNQPTLQVYDPEEESSAPDVSQIVLSKMLEGNYRHFVRMLNACKKEDSNCKKHNLTSRTFIDDAERILEQRLILNLDKEEVEEVLAQLRALKPKLEALRDVQANESSSIIEDLQNGNAEPLNELLVQCSTERCSLFRSKPFLKSIERILKHPQSEVENKEEILEEFLRIKVQQNLMEAEQVNYIKSNSLDQF